MKKGSAELFIVDTFGMFITRIYTRRAFFMSPTSPPGSIWVSIDKARMQVHSKMPCLLGGHKIFTLSFRGIV